MSRKDTWRQFAADLFSEAVSQSGMSDVDVADALRGELERDNLSRQTIGAWKRGDQAPPSPATWALLKIAEITLAEALAPVLLRNPDFAALMVTPASDSARERYETAMEVLAAISERTIRMHSQGSSPKPDSWSQGHSPDLGSDQTA